MNFDLNRLLLAAVASSIFSMTLTGCGHSSTSGMEAEYTLTSDEVVQEFLDNDTAASSKYIDKVIAVSGPVFEIDKTDGKITGVKLSSDEMFIVNATFQEPVEDIEQGEITIKGVCSGFLGDSESMLPGGTVELKRSAIVKL